MNLPGRLRATTLGDLLGTIHRHGATGTLELAEDRGRVHHVHFAGGLVVAVELDGRVPSLAELLRTARAADDDVLRRSLLRAMASKRLHGEVLVEDFHLSPDVVDGTLRRQASLRLSALDAIPDARVCFRVAIRRPREALHGQPLGAGEFLHGRRRRRDRGALAPSAPRAEIDACLVLGVAPGVDRATLKAAYRRLVKATHPDAHPDASDDERRALAARFTRVTEAYRTLEDTTNEATG